MDTLLLVNLFHIFVVFPFVLYLVFELRNGRIPDERVINVMLYVAIAMVLYHSYRAYQRLTAI